LVGGLNVSMYFVIIILYTYYVELWPEIVYQKLKKKLVLKVGT